METLHLSFKRNHYAGLLIEKQFLRLNALERGNCIVWLDQLGLSSLYLSFRRPSRGGNRTRIPLICFANSSWSLSTSNIEEVGVGSLEGTGRIAWDDADDVLDVLSLDSSIDE
ncbi:hypothetical protein Tco_0575827, partial [Tanacetum coccineum]